MGKFSRFCLDAFIESFEDHKKEKGKVREGGREGGGTTYLSR